MIKTYKDGHWLFIYYPKKDFLMLLFKGLRKGFWPYGTSIAEAAHDSLSDAGIESFKNDDWDSYIIDTEVTKDWKEAERIAARHFNTTAFFDLPKEQDHER